MSKYSRSSITRWEGIAFIVAIASISIVPLAPKVLPMLNDWQLESDPERYHDVVIMMLIQENGGFDPNIIRVKVDQPVRLILMSQDAVHSFVLPAFGIDTGPAFPMKQHIEEFTPDKIGTFEFYCAVFCTPSHWDMTGLLIVEAV